ncbi:AAA family ATPase [Nocardia farcinica]|uniref:Putative phage polynucleotide kinase n=1 Tax=Nocardia farcinica (strain IFM 10152) TaxID=247156 RepID=Q5YSP0_NOCFA|nr:AAA family ATPase [Nocardia farcinica]BAD58801.1 putative phage polynucleotide kinase [Nocardia farcinica IFM 10152]
MIGEKLVLRTGVRPRVILPRGYPGSGKSTLYTRLKEADPLLARVSRDDARMALFGQSGMLTPQQEEIISKAERAQAAALLDAGYDVYVDATNLRLKWARGWADFAALHGAEFQVIDLDTPVDECIRRDAERAAAGGRAVGKVAIEALAKRFPRRHWPTITASPDLFFYPTPYVPDETLPPAWIVDVDGTLADKAPGRGIYDYTRVFEDIPIAHTVEVVRKLAADAAIVILSGRDDDSRTVTADWLTANGVPFTELRMRATGDKRPDYLVKYGIFDQQIRDRYRVLGVFDDRLSVCRMWDRLGVPLMRLGRPDQDDF